MRSVKFDEKQINDLNSVAQNLFSEENDPRSSSYKRVLFRPQINWLLMIVWSAFFVILPISVYKASLYILKARSPAVLITAAAIILYILFTAKYAVIQAVRLYQKFAPDSIRMKCRFEPSCSEYMIMAIRKYGLIKGIKKGVNRLKRCNVNNGGYDYP